MSITDAHSARALVIRWQSNASELSPTLNPPQFELRNRETFLCDALYFGGMYVFSISVCLMLLKMLDFPMCNGSNAIETIFGIKTVPNVQNNAI